MNASPDQPAHLSNLAIARQARFQHTGDLADLDRAVDLLRRAVAATPDGHPDRAEYLSDLGAALGMRFDRTGDLADLDHAVDLLRAAVAAIPDGHPNQAGYLSRLGHGRQTRFRRTGDPADLDQAIEAGEQAVNAAPGQPAYLSSLAIALLARFQSTGDLADLDRAVDLGERAVDAVPGGHANQAGYLTRLGSALLARFDRTGDPADLDRAIEVGEQAVNVTPEGHPDQAGPPSNLGSALLARFERTGDLADLDRAIEVGEQAVAVAPDGHPDRAKVLSNLGNTRQARFRSTGDPADLDRAIEVGEQAVNATPDGHPDQAAYLSNLGNAWQARFQRTGDLAGLDRAIEVGEQAVNATPDGHPDRAGRLANLGNALGMRFDRTGDLSDLDRAIDLFQRGVDATPGDHADRAGGLSSLGNALGLRFERTGDLADLDRAIDAGERAVDATPGGHANRAGYLTNLGGALLARFGRTGDLADLDRAIDLYQQSADTTPDGHPNRAGYLSNLGDARRIRFANTEDPADLDRAIDLIQAGVDLTPDGHPNRAGYLLNLGIALRIRFTQTGSAVDLDRGMASFREAAGVISAPADVRAWSAQEWGRLAVRAERWAEGVEGLGTAVGLAGLLASRGLAQADQEYRLGRLRGLGPEAAAACLQADRPGRAVELFEQGRGVLFSQVLDARSDLTELMQAQPELAAQFIRWRDELDRSARVSAGAGHAGPAGDPQLPAHQRRDAATEFERVLAEIRMQPGFEHFLAPRPVQDLLAAALGGPVVLVNVASLRSDALILTTTGVDVLPLRGVDPDRAVEQAGLFLETLNQLHDRAASGAVRAVAETALGGVLNWLWDHVTGPVLDHLGYTATPAEGDDWPRVWWCPSGPLSLLPLHAAGYHDLAGGRSAAVIDRVISSTIPTVRALLHAGHARPLSRPPRTLVVAMPHTPGQEDLPGVAHEVATLRRLLPGHVDVLGLPDTEAATYDSVTTALPGHPWAHFACHGYSSLADPSASHLLLADHRARPLTVVDLTHTHLEQAELAFLSACTTARTGAALPDEPIHLAAACQLAGYHHVIATLWPISDNDAAYLTETFYTALVTTPATPASALHYATRQLRAINRIHPSHWAAYIYTGS